MKTFAPRNQIDNLSTLARQLRELELAEMGDLRREVSHTRNALIAVLKDYAYTRYQFGRLLHAYKAFYKPEGRWLAAAKLIGAAIRRDERTIFRIVEDFERADQVAPILLHAMGEQQIDPSAPKNDDIIEDLKQAPPTASPRQAAKIVTKAVKAHAERKKAARESRKNEKLEDFVERIARFFLARYAGLPQEQSKAEMERILRLLAGRLGIRFGPRSLLPPKPPELMKAV